MSVENKKICLITLGCSKNLVDSEVMLGGIRNSNYSITEEPKDADTIIVNTCGFLDSAREESVDVILEAGSLKKKGKFICIDSFNENPIYVCKRILNILRGKRTLTTLRRIPNFSFLKKYGLKFKRLKIIYFGKISWLYPFLVPLIGINRFCKLSENIDKMKILNFLAFKIIIEATKD